MQKLVLLNLLCLSCNFLQAQSTKLPSGKKFQVVTETQTSMTMSVMGQDMEFENNGTNVSDYELKTITDNGYTLNSSIKRIKTNTTAAGQTQSFDSDDQSMRSNPQFAEVIKMLNKPNEIVVENNMANVKGDIANMVSSAGLSGIGSDQSKFILSGDISRFMPGYQWADSSAVGNNRNLNEYIVTKVNDAGVEILVKSISKINGTVTQGGMAVKQDMTGNITALRQYDKATGLLTTEQTDMAISGSMEIMGQSAPVNMKGKITTTVK